MYEDFKNHVCVNCHFSEEFEVGILVHQDFVLILLGTVLSNIVTYAKNSRTTILKFALTTFLKSVLSNIVTFLLRNSGEK